MRTSLSLRAWSFFAVLFTLLPAAINGQIPAGTGAAVIRSVNNADEGLTIQSVSGHTGFVTFAASVNGIQLTISPSASAELRAIHFVDKYGAGFGLASGAEVRSMRAAVVDELGIEHVRLQQIHKGVPVRAGELIVHLRGTRVLAANGHTANEMPDDVEPDVPADHARSTARILIGKHRYDTAADVTYTDPRLEIFDRGLLSETSDLAARLAWFIEANGPALREWIWIDAENGAVLLHFSQLAEAKSRRIHNGGHVYTLPGTVVRNEGGAATGDADQDNAYTYSGVTYDYFATNHGRDSYDGAGAALVSTAHHCPQIYPQGSTCPDFRNAFWNGTQMVYADGYASADDVVAHELTHAITERTAGLFYYNQSGALNESFSDIFGETVDLTDGLGNDASSVRWRIGEELPNGSIRNMMTPNSFGDPGKLSDSAYFVCNSSAYTDETGDGGGVHTNSNVPNHGYALMVDGGTYNNTTITGIGLTKAAKIQYRALTLYLTSGSGFLDDYNALNQSCTDLVGVAGITSLDCVEVTKALQAVEMNNRWPCFGATTAPPLCGAGSAVNVFSDNFEASLANWTVTNSYGIWSRTTGFAKGGSYMIWGRNPDDVSDHRVAKTAGVTLPANARLYFDHAFEFENESDTYDGGVIEYSTNDGASWIDAGSLIDGGQSYNGVVASAYANPVGGRSAFTASSYGFTGTRLNLSSLAGQSVRFRFRIGSDVTIGSMGWMVDNVAIYTCSNSPTGSFSVVDGTSNLGSVNPGAESSSVVGNTGVVLTDVARTSTGAMYAVDYNYLYSLNPATGARSLIGALGGGASGMNALVGNGTGLLAASINSNSLYSVNPGTGAATALTGSLGYPSMGDLAFLNGILYAAVKNGTFSDLVRVTLSGNSFTAVNLGHVTSDNALFGFAVGSDQNLYGVSGTKVIRINVTNPAASSVVVYNYAWSGSGLGSANGAASSVPAPFTNDPLVPFSSVIRAVHINDLRTRIAAIRASWGLSVFSWTDPTLTATSTRIKAVHLTELRTALSQAYTAAGRTPPVFTNASLVGVFVKALHISELRNGVIAME